MRPRARAGSSCPILSGTGYSRSRRLRLYAALGVAVGLAASLPATGVGHPPPRAQHARAPGPDVPILMYHVLADPPTHAPFPELYVGRAAFTSQMVWLARHGYHPVTLLAVFDHWAGRGSLPRRPVVLSFDDGYRSDYTTGYRVLRARGWPGVLNLEVRNTTVSWGLSPGRVRRMIAAGWEVDAHTLTHPDLTTVDAARLRREVAGSRSELRRLFGVPVDFFCYPAGRYDAAVVAEVRRAGYLGATTTRFGLARPSEPYTLARVRVNRSDGVAGLAAELRSLGLAH